MLGGSASTSARATRVALPVPAGPQLVDQALEERLHVGRGQHVERRRVGRQVGEGAAGVQAREDQQADLVAVHAGDHHVLHAGVAGGDDARAQRADETKVPVDELEVLGDAAVEQEAAARVRPGRSSLTASPLQ